MLLESGNKNDILDLVEKYRSNRSSVLSRIFSILVLPGRKLTDLIEKSPIRFIGIVLAELSGWTKSTINKDIVTVNDEIRGRFELLNQQIDQLAHAIAYGNIEGSEIFNEFENILESVDRLEKIPGNESRTIFELQYELRKFVTDYFAETILELSKELLVLKIKNRSIHFIEAIPRYILNPAYQVIMEMFNNPDCEEFSNITALKDKEGQSILQKINIEKYKAIVQQFRNRFDLILKTFYPDISDMEIGRYIKGFNHECMVDIQTMIIPFRSLGYIITENQIIFKDDDEPFKGHSYSGYKEPSVVFDMESNEEAIFKNSYENYSLRSYKDCHAYAHVRKFLQSLQRLIRIESEYGEITRIYLAEEFES